MDPNSIKILKSQAIHKHKKPQYQTLSNTFFYCLSVLTCSIFCCSPLWFPSLFSSMKVFFFGFVPMISSVLLSSKFVFILGNLIVVALVGESKIFSTVSSPPNIHVEYEERVKRCQRFQSSSAYKEEEPEKVNLLFEESVLMKMNACGDGDQVIEGKGCEEQSKELVVEEVKEDVVEDEDDEELILPEDHQFNRRADDFIARVNERRRYELLLCNGE